MLLLPRLQQTPDSRPLADVQRALIALVTELNNVAILDGRLVEGVTLAAGVPKDVVHGLGRQLRGWIPVRLFYPGVAAVVAEGAGNPNDALYVRLLCAQNAALTLWAF